MIPQVKHNADVVNIVPVVKIEKNLLPSIYFNKLKNIVTSHNFQWYFQTQTVTSKFHKADNNFMFTHNLFAFEQGQNSDWFKEFEPIVYFLDNKIKIKKLLRMKLNLYTNQNKKIEHISHTDINDKVVPRKNVTIAIFNLTTCNGGTIIKGKKYPSTENEVLIFNNLNKHGGIVQTDTQTRIVLNIATE